MRWPWSKKREEPEEVTEEEINKALRDLHRKTLSLELDIRRTKKMIVGFDFNSSGQPAEVPEEGV